MKTNNEADAPAQGAEPGTPEAVVEALFAIAERECGHSRVSSQHALTTIELWIAEAKRESATLAKRIYDAGMMLCCVNDIEQNPLEDLIKGNLQMLAGYHESEKRLMAQLEQARADGWRLLKALEHAHENTKPVRAE